MSFVFNALLVLAAVTGQTAPGGTATDAIKARDAEIRAALPAPGAAVTPEVKKKLEGILTRAVDLEGIGRAALGKTWDAQPKAKQKRFLDAFLTGFKAAIGGQLDTFRSSETSFGKEKLDGELTIVPTTFTVKGEPTEIIYSMKKDPAGGWRIADLTIDEVSTIENYRGSFGRIVAKEGFDGLIARLEKHPASANKAAADKP